jgi:small subunit ribosomal protein S15
VIEKMARMYSRKRGKAGSTKPTKKLQSSWVRYKDKEVEMLIVKLAKQEKTPSEIGLILRDMYGIPYVRQVAKKRITKILEEHKLLAKIPEDMMALIKRSIALRKHLERNHKDESAKRGLTLTESKIKRLARYYKKTGKLAETWKYQPEKIKVYLE